MTRLAYLVAAAAIACGGDDGGSVEPDAAGGTDIATDAIAPSDGANSVDLGTVGVDFLAGTTVEFDFSVAAGIVTLENFGVTAGPTGAQIRGPLVVLVVSATENPDPADRFDSVLLQLEPSESGAIAETGSDFAHVADAILDGASVQLIFRFDQAAPL